MTIGGAASGADSGIALNRPSATARGAGSAVPLAPKPSAAVTARLLRSTALRLPFHSSQLPPLTPAEPTPSLRTSTASSAPRAAARDPPSASGPVIRVTPTTSPVAASQTVQSASREVLGTMRSGAPGMPMRLPRANLSSSALGTMVGLSGRPAMSRADVRFSTGCSWSPTRAYSAEVSRSARITSLPATPAGRISEKTKQPASAVTSTRPPTRTERLWVRNGSTSIRVSCMATPDAMRRLRNRQPDTWCRVTKPRR
ncbi:Uncharacterised protein [Mycobacteroides abscessus subsp. abscessus]|nr:Uncharacterised protein [Mycobacteroides abscessus subsp. abscessus]